MAIKRLRLNEAERAMLMMLKDHKQFRSVEIAIRDGQWHIQSHVQRAIEEPLILFGSGATFAEAWFDRCDPRLRFGPVH
jgi:hypothetical protein